MLPIYVFRSLILLFASAFLSKIVFLTITGSSPVSVWSSSGLYGLFWGIRLDFVVVSILTTLIALMHIISSKFSAFRKLPLYVLIVSIVGIIVATMADAIYGMDTGAHVTFELFTTDDSKFGLLMTAFKIAPLAIVSALVLCSVLIVCVLHLDKKIEQTTIRFSSKTASISFILLLLFTITVVRGGWSDAPQSPMNANKIGDSKQAYVAWSAPYSIAYYSLKGAKRAAIKFTPDVPVPVDTSTSPFKLGELKQANVIIVLLESWASADMKSYAGDVDATPFFDQLRKQSLSAKAMYANGYRTVQGLFASVCSYPNPLSSTVAGTQLQTFSYQCLPDLLRGQGWDTHFIQGSGKGMVGQFAQFLGYTHSYGKEDYSFDALKNDWGFMDDGIYRFSLDKIRELEHHDGPWMITINTGTTHDISLPDQVPFRFGNSTYEQTRRSVVYYADQELSRFIKKLNKLVTKPTLVVLEADHTKIGGNQDLSAFSIPFLMYATDGSIPPTLLNKTIAQADIAPSILDWLGGNIPDWFMGHSLLKPETLSNTAYFSQGEMVGWIDQNRFVRFNAYSGLAEQCAHVANDTISLQMTDCRSEDFPAILKQATTFTDLSQELLFSGKTTRFRPSMLN